MEIPIQTVHLFPKLDQELIGLLKSLSPEDWSKPTLAKLWTVKDVATHLLDGNIRTLSTLRDAYFDKPPENINSYQDLVKFLNQLNADWVKATRRMSPRVLIELLDVTGREYSAVLKKLDPFKPAVFPVAWAGQQVSENWFHIAREYTEKWHHQQQIREAVGKPGLMTREFYYPLIDTFMQALPHAYREVHAQENQAIRITVTSEAGGDWFLEYTASRWKLGKNAPVRLDAAVVIDPHTAWKLFTKAITAEEAGERIEFSGDQALGRPVLSMVSVMA